MIVIGYNENPQNALMWGASNEAWEEKFHRSDEGSCLQTLYDKIGCNLVDCVEIANGIDMWVDDEGALKSSRRLNHIATALRTLFWANNEATTIPVNYPPLHGVAVLLGHDEEGNSIDLTPEQVAYIRSLIPVRTIEEDEK